MIADISKLWKTPDKEPEDLKWILVKFQGAIIEKGYYDKAHHVVAIGMDTVSWSSITKWCYLEDIEPEEEVDFDDVDPHHLVHQHIKD